MIGKAWALGPQIHLAVNTYQDAVPRGRSHSFQALLTVHIPVCLGRLWISHDLGSILRALIHPAATHGARRQSLEAEQHANNRQSALL
jgi:hypothetical protein